MKYWLPIIILLCAGSVHAQCTAPTITATAKGPDQVNLTWAAASNPCYGYDEPEIQSAGDSRYSSFTRFVAIPAATGYTAAGGACAISDVSGTHIYNPQTLGRSAHLYGSPTWVTEANYVDPQDSTAVQFIVYGLKPNVSYSFRMRSYDPSSYSVYSNTSTVTTLNYTTHFVNTATGSDANGGTNSTSDAWKTIQHGVGTLTAGNLLLVEAGNYAADEIFSNGTSGLSGIGNKIVVEADTGAAVTITSAKGGAGSNSVLILDNYWVIDGISVVSGFSGDYSTKIVGNNIALFGMNVGSPTATLANGSFNQVSIPGTFVLVYGNYVHDANSPCAAQNPSGNSGETIALNGGQNSVVWSNHITRGGHDTGACLSVSLAPMCQFNKFLNNVMDGGYGLGFNLSQGFSTDALFEGNVLFHAGYMEEPTIFKPALEIADTPNVTARRNLIITPGGDGFEITNLTGVVPTNVKFYNNTIIDAATVVQDGVCLFESSNLVATNQLIVNNICTTNYNVGFLVYHYSSDLTGSITHNDFVYINAGVASPSTSNIRWNILASGACSTGCPIATMDSAVNPPWSNNAVYAVIPAYGNSAIYDFHLIAGSALTGVGVAVTDASYGNFAGSLNLGAFNNSFVTPIQQAPASPIKVTILAAQN